MSRRVDVHKADLKVMWYENLEHWLESPQHVYVGRNVVYVAGARQHESEACQILALSMIFAGA